nr:WAS/WASL-interacting protein family member 3-like [Setaria viridis]
MPSARLPPPPPPPPIFSEFCNPAPSPALSYALNFNDGHAAAADLVLVAPSDALLRRPGRLLLRTQLCPAALLGRTQPLPAVPSPARSAAPKSSYPRRPLRSPNPSATSSELRCAPLLFLAAPSPTGSAASKSSHPLPALRSSNPVATSSRIGSPLLLLAATPWR